MNSISQRLAEALDLLARLVQLRDSGGLTVAEFRTAKAKVLDKILP